MDITQLIYEIVKGILLIIAGYYLIAFALAFVFILFSSIVLLLCFKYGKINDGK